MFSPYYAWSGRGDPENHAAVNVALYTPGRYRWTMTERRRTAIVRERRNFVVGPSSLRWTGDGLVIDIDEMAVPLPRRVRGRVRLIPETLSQRPMRLDAAGRHVWWPIAPRARVEAAFTSPDVAWSGSGYLDTNAGHEPLEAGFRRWDWSRGDLGEGAAVLYDGVRRDGSRFSLGLKFDRGGGCEHFEPPPSVPLPTTAIWRMPRRTQAENGEAKVMRTLEDTPFYARSVVATRLLGEPATAVHESLSLDRLARPIVKLMLPFRMPRAFR